MVLSAFADDHLLAYIQELAKTEICSVGLILGQPTPGKVHILHFARTPPYHGQAFERAAYGSTANIKSINEITDTWVAEHAIHATRLLPGGIYVVGIFIISKEDLLTPLSPKIKSILNQVRKQLSVNKYLQGNVENMSDKLVLNYCTKTAQFTCKNYNMQTASLRPVVFKFQSNDLHKWHELECYYDLDQIVPIGEVEKDLPLKKHMASIMKSIEDNLKSAVFLFDGELHDMDDYLGNFIRKKKGHKMKGEQADSKPIQVTIFFQCDAKHLCKTLEVKNTAGQIKLSGQVACRLWLHPKATVSTACEAVTEDLLRSLAARLEMHWDSLIEEEHGSPEDTNSIHEPPRRVMVALPKTNLTLSDYLFPGEGPQEAQISLQELLDIKVNEKDAIKDIEGQADLTDIYNENLEVESEEKLPKLPTDTNKFMYMMGLGVALLVLIISLVVHYFQ